MSTATISSREELLALIAEFDAREAVAFAATGHVEQASAISARRLAAEAPALAPLKAPKGIAGTTVSALIAAGQDAAIVHTPHGVQVVRRFDAEDPTVIVLADYWEIAPLVLVEGQRPADVARDLKGRELDAYDYATAA